MAIENQRLLDLVRVCRSALFVDHELIDEAEYAWLAGLPSAAAHERLRDYADLRVDLEQAAKVTEQLLDDVVIISAHRDRRAAERDAVQHLLDVATEESSRGLTYAMERIRELEAERDAAVSEAKALREQVERLTLRRIADVKSANAAATSVRSVLQGFSAMPPITLSGAIDHLNDITRSTP